MNFLDEYFKYAIDLVDCPQVFHRFLARAIVGIACKNRVYYQFGDMRIFPNIWMILVAPSSFYRKTTAIQVAINIMKSVDENIMLPNEFSPEALLPVLQERPYGSFFFSEFKTLAKILEKEYMSYAESLLTTLYDVPPVYTRQLRKESFQMKYPCVSLLSATTINWFISSLKEDDIAGGYLPRYMIIPGKVKERWFIPPPVDMLKKNLIVHKLNNIIELITAHAMIQSKDDELVNANFLRISFTESAFKEYSNWAKEFEISCSQNNLIAPFYSRLAIYIIKLAMIEALADGVVQMDTLHFEKAKELIVWISEELKELQEKEFAFDDFQKRRQKVIRIIRNHPAGISREKLIKDAKILSRELNWILDHLKEERGGIEERERINAVTGRKVKYYILNEAEV